VIGGGASLRGFEPECLRGQKIIVVNSACRLIPWADVLFYTDTHWFMQQMKIVKEFQGMRVTVDRRTKGEFPTMVKRINAIWRPNFRVEFPYTVRQGRSSGHTAIALAIAMGAKVVVLLGFDLCLIDGKSHFHNDYRVANPQLYERDFAPAFAGWNKDAQEVGVSILNATPGSALKEFQMVALSDVLEGRI